MNSLSQVSAQTFLQTIDWGKRSKTKTEMVNFVATHVLMISVALICIYPLLIPLRFNQTINNCSPDISFSCLMYGTGVAITNFIIWGMASTTYFVAFGIFSCFGKKALVKSLIDKDREIITQIGSNQDLKWEEVRTILKRERIELDKQELDVIYFKNRTSSTTYHAFIEEHGLEILDLLTDERKSKLNQSILSDINGLNPNPYTSTYPSLDEFYELPTAPPFS